jgi:hypothetical protein
MFSAENRTLQTPRRFAKRQIGQNCARTCAYQKPRAAGRTDARACAQRVHRQADQLANSIRGYAAEFGFTAPKGLSRLQQLLIDIRDDTTVPNLAKELVEAWQ